MTEYTKFLFGIAKIIDNAYIGKDKTFYAERKPAIVGYWFLGSTGCDMCNNIRLYDDGRITINDDDGWRPIMPDTAKKVEDYVNKPKL